VQKHAARRLHYDFRLELDGTLKSWAVPKGPSLDPADKRLAVHVEDHPLEYGDFEGVILARIDKGKARLYTRNGHDWTARFAAIARDLEARKPGPAWLDGEVCVLDARGRTTFSALQRVLSGESSGPALYFIFDAPFLAGKDLRSLPLTERRDALERALGKLGALSTLRFSAAVAGTGAEVQAQACKSGLEGVLGKRADSPYRHERTRDWIKLKCRQRQEFVIGGYTAPGGSRHGLGALLLGVHEKSGELRYAGRVGTGMDDAMLTALEQKLSRLRTEVSPFARPPAGRLARGVQWVQPRLVGEVSFAEWTHDGHVRQASFEGLREDKPEAEVEREVARAPPHASARSSRARVTTRSRSAKAAPASPPTIAGVKITHPERVVYPDAGITKLMVAEYYERVAPRLLPYVTGRPLSIVRCPEGTNGACFFQKHVGDFAIPGVEVAMIEDSTGRNRYIVASTAKALVGLAQMNALELHAWGAKAAAIERPDTMILDLDPDPALPWATVVTAARLTRTLLDELGLACLVKTTGGKGLHVVVPLERRHGWEEVKDFAQDIAAHLANTLPDQFTATVSKARRRGKIFVDYLRNTRGATAVAPYSLRARRGATVATPLSWDELSAKILPTAFTIATVPGRIAKKKDPWADYERRRQRLTAAMRRALR
jgi:bifunctional non-homologous end joining protein LigD